MTWTGASEDAQIHQGHSACAGCGMILGVRHLLEEAGDDVTLVVPASCAGVVQGIYPYTAFDVPVVNTAFAAGPSTASGIEMAKRSRDEPGDVVVLAGDGGSTDIGLSSLSGTLERDHDLLYVLYDNEAYSNTGFQKSSRTPKGARTTTTPTGRVGNQKDIGEIVASHDPVYAASASPAFLEDLRRKTRRGLDADGASFLHLHAPCPPGWRMETDDTVAVAKAAVSTGLWVLYERDADGEIVVNQPSKAAFRNPDPVDTYVQYQRRFSTATDADIETLQETADENVERYSAYLEEGNS